MYRWAVVHLYPNSFEPSGPYGIPLFFNDYEAKQHVIQRMRRHMDRLGPYQARLEPLLSEAEEGGVTIRLWEELLAAWNEVAWEVEGVPRFLVRQPHSGTPSPSLDALVDRGVDETIEMLRDDPDQDVYELAQLAAEQVVPLDFPELIEFYYRQNPDVDLGESIDLQGTTDLATVLETALEREVASRIFSREDDVRSAVPPESVEPETLRAGSEKEVQAVLHLLSMLRRYLYSAPEPVIEDFPSFQDTIVRWDMAIDPLGVSRWGRQLAPCPPEVGAGGVEWNPSWTRLVQEAEGGATFDALWGFLWRVWCFIRTESDAHLPENPPLWAEVQGLDFWEPLNYRVEEHPFLPWLAPPIDLGRVELNFVLGDHTYVRLPIWFMSEAELNEAVAHDVLLPPSWS